MKKLLMTVALCAIASTVSAKTINETVDVTNCRVYDGDTIYCDLPCDLSWRCDDIGIRIKGIDAPEVSWRAKCPSELKRGVLAKTKLGEVVEYGEKVSIVNFKPNGAYGRIEADVMARGVNLAPYLLNNGFVRKSKGKRESWCTDEEIMLHNEFKRRQKMGDK